MEAHLPAALSAQRSMSAVGASDFADTNRREPINSEWSGDVRFGMHSGLKSDLKRFGEVVRLEDVLDVRQSASNPIPATKHSNGCGNSITPFLW